MGKRKPRIYKEMSEEYREMCKASTNKYRKKNPETVRRWWLKAYYGITPEQFEEMYSFQEGKCPICLRDIPHRGRGVNVDHCHTTGKVRGLLCSPCNLYLGHFKDDETLMMRAILYVRGGGSNSVV